MIEKLNEIVSEECFLCCDAPQPPYITRCCHGPACRECWTRSLEASVRFNGLQLTLRMHMLKEVIAQGWSADARAQRTLALRV